MMTLAGLILLVLGLMGQLLVGAFFAIVLFRLPDLLVRKSDRQSQTVGGPRWDLLLNFPIPLSEIAGLGCALGIGISAWILFVWSYFGGRLGVFPSGVLAMCGFAVTGPILLVRTQDWFRKRASKLTRPIASSPEQAVCIGCQSMIGILFVTTLLQTLQTPQKLWDERAIFALKARVLFEDHTIRSEALLHPDFVQYHPRYPLLLPLAEQNIYALYGMVDDRLSKLIFPLLYMGLVLATAGVLQRHLSRQAAWIGALLIATIPVLMPYEYGVFCGQADAPVACYHGLSLLYLWDALSRHRRQKSSAASILLAGIFGGFTAFTKDEGIAYLLIDGGILGLFALCSVGNRQVFGQSLLGTALFVASAGSILVPWFAHRRSLPMTTEMNYFGRMTLDLFIGRLETLRWSVPHLLRRMFWEWREWGLQWWFMVAAFVGWPSRAIQPPQLLFVLDVVGSLAALLVAGMLAPAQLDEHIGGSSHRFLMQIAPVAVLFAVTVMFGETDHGPARENS
jgi:hypothetical protein